MDTAPKFAGGRNNAMKVPPHLWDVTVRFYQDVVGLRVIEHPPTEPPSACFEFGANQLWMDRVAGLSQSEMWLELTTADIGAAADRLNSEGVVCRDEIEPLPNGFDGFWITARRRSSIWSQNRSSTKG